MSDDLTPDELLDLWFGSNAWSEITRDAEMGDQDSVQLMEEVNEQLASIIFHLSNKSGSDRIYYELIYFQRLCNDFGVA
jgi:hypothetical protein